MSAEQKQSLRTGLKKFLGVLPYLLPSVILAISMVSSVYSPHTVETALATSTPTDSYDGVPAGTYSYSTAPWGAGHQPGSTETAGVNSATVNFDVASASVGSVWVGSAGHLNLNQTSASITVTHDFVNDGAVLAGADGTTIAAAGTTFNLQGAGTFGLNGHALTLQNVVDTLPITLGDSDHLTVEGPNSLIYNVVGNDGATLTGPANADFYLEDSVTFSAPTGGVLTMSNGFWFDPPGNGHKTRLKGHPHHYHNSNCQNEGWVETDGHDQDSDDTIVHLQSDFCAENLRIRNYDTWDTAGYEMTIDHNIFIDGALDSTDTGTPHEGDGTQIVLGGDWTNTGSFTAANSSVRFEPNTANQSDLDGSTTFYDLIGRKSGTTLRFEANQMTLVTHKVEFRNVTLRSQTNGTRWKFKYTGSSMTVVGVDVKDSDASFGQTVYADITSTNSGNNVNWVFGFTAPSNLNYTGSATTSLTGSWTGSVPTADSYTIQLSTASNLTGTIFSANGTSTSNTVTGLAVNTTYYGRVYASIAGTQTGYSAIVSSGTQANAPITGTWSGVSAQSATVNWNANSNPAGTHFRVDMSSSSSFAF
ncbi:MAG: fibronectin type III domain-containing protein, partial [Elusimicrobia bacterium]|nr:fibronectin type III domain-containing protein [Elusimicrobiota bacterium]